MVIGSLVEERDAPEAIEETGYRKKNTPKNIRLLIPC